MDKATHPNTAAHVEEDPLDLFEAEETPSVSDAVPVQFESLHASMEAASRAAAPAYDDRVASSADTYQDVPAPWQMPEPAYIPPPAPNRPFTPAVPARESVALTAWLQRNALSVAAVLVACLGSAAIVIGMRHRTDTELDGWSRSEAQAPAVLPTRSATASGSEPSRPAADGNAEELAAARPRADGLTGATGTTASEAGSRTGNGTSTALQASTAPQASNALQAIAAARDASARDAAQRAATPTPVVPPRTAANTPLTNAPLSNTPLTNKPNAVTANTGPANAGAANGALNGAAARTANAATPPAASVPAPPRTTANANLPPAATPVVETPSSMPPLVTPNAGSRVASNTIAPPPTAPVTVPDPPVLQPSAATTTPPAASPSSAIAAAPAIVPPAAPTVRDRRESVQAVVNRYRDAYNSLDAQAAKSVWPAVNTKQLSDAFARLEKQEFQFASCSVFLESSVQAKATCEGSVRFVPRGSRERTERRRWEFTLKEVNREWSIDAVK